jgi:hypothetical protein
MQKTLGSRILTLKYTEMLLVLPFITIMSHEVTNSTFICLSNHLLYGIVSFTFCVVLTTTIFSPHAVT